MRSIHRPGLFEHLLDLCGQQGVFGCFQKRVAGQQGQRFALGGMKIGKNFFRGSLAGMIASSALLDLLTVIPIPFSE